MKGKATGILLFAVLTLLNGTSWGGSYNTFYGTSAGGSTTGDDDTAVGYMAGYHNGTGSRNSFYGSGAGYYNTSGQDNTFFGTGTGTWNFVGNQNTIIGSQAGYTTAGSGNVLLGYQAGYSESGSSKLYIANSGTSTPLIYGDFWTGELVVNGSLTLSTPPLVFSDERFKKNISPLGPSLGRVMKMQGVTFDWKTEEFPGRGFTAKHQIGLVAQEVEKILPEVVNTDSKGYKAISYDKLVPVLIEAVKEQQKKILDQQEAFHKTMSDKEAEIDLLKKTVMDISNRLSAIENSVKTVASK